MTAGAPANRDNTCIYNCSSVDHPRAFDEAVHIVMWNRCRLLSRTRRSVRPSIPAELVNADVIVVPDSKEGWARSYRKLISMLI